MDPSIKHRLLLSLRSERAMGLRFVDAPGTEVRALPPTETVEVDEELARAEQPVASPALFAPPPPAVVPAVSLPVLSTQHKRAALAMLDETEVRGCPKCRLCSTRTQTVFGEGDVDAKVFFVGEGPGEKEDETGRPFVGRAGVLLDKMIASTGLTREQVYIANCVKCRPPANRVPAPDEAATCMPYLFRQLETVQPRVIVTLGLTAAKYMLGDNKLAMNRIRGQWHAWRGVRLMPTFHPAYVLRAYTPANRQAVWDDLQLVMAEIGLARPASKNGP